MQAPLLHAFLVYLAALEAFRSFITLWNNIYYLSRESQSQGLNFSLVLLYY